MILSGIVLVFAALLLETSTKVYVDSKNAAVDSQKIQIAMNRLVKELTFAGVGTVEVPNGRTIHWVSRHPDRLGELGSVTWDGTSGSDLEFSTTEYQGAVLLDNVSLFTVSSTAGSITITLKTRKSDSLAHTMIIHPRYDL